MTMALPRFLVDSIDEATPVVLPEAESHHASRVLRMDAGDPCVVFDGAGHEAQGVIASVEKRAVTVACCGKRFAPRDHDNSLQFAIAMPKGDRQRNVIEKLVELGVDRLILLETHRSVSKFDADAVEKLRRYGMEACKQCQRNRLMEIEPSVRWEQWVASQSRNAWILHPKGLMPENAKDGFLFDTHGFLETACQPSCREDASASVGPIVFAVGPEGGFTDQEIEVALEHSLRVLDLGERILRVETAVALAATLGSLVLT